MHTQELPDIMTIMDPILGLPYAQYDCWQLLRFVFDTGWGIAFDTNPVEAMQQVQEIWWQEDPRDPLSLVQAWDVVIFISRGFSSQHVGVMCDRERFLHTRPRTGVCTEYLQRWRRHLLQIARLKRLA